MGDLRILRLGPSDLIAARDLLAMMVDVFNEGPQEGTPQKLPENYLGTLLNRDSFWVLGAFAGTEIVGGLTAHILPMTRSASWEVFIYDLAVRQDHQRQGIGSRLIQELRDCAAEAGIGDVFVAADNEDEHALDFYRAQGAAASPVTVFTFAARQDIH